MIEHRPRHRCGLLRREHFLHDALEQREVPADPRLQPQVRQPGAIAEQRRPRFQRMHEILRVLEPLRAHLGQRIDRHDGRAPGLRRLERRQHARMVCPRILPDHKNRLRLFEILQRHRALADPDGLPERHAARLVAHVRAVRQIVRPKLPHEQLPEKRRLVAGAARRIKRRRIRRRQRPQFGRDERKRLVPPDRRIVRRARAQHHRLRQPPLRVEPVVALRREFGHRMVLEKLRGDPLQRRLVRHGLRPVLAKLKRMPLAVRARPRAALAVEAVLLVHLEQQLRPAHRAHCAQRDLRRDAHRREPGRGRARRAQRGAGEFDGRLGRGNGGLGHARHHAGGPAQFNSRASATRAFLFSDPA